MTVLDVIVLAFIATGLMAAAMTFFSPRLTLAGLDGVELGVADLQENRSRARTHFGGTPARTKREPAVASFPRAL